MPASVPQAVQACHELLLWLIPQLDKFPRSRRFTLGERIEAGLLDVLELLVEAAYTRKKRYTSSTVPRCPVTEASLASRVSSGAAKASARAR